VGGGSTGGGVCPGAGAPQPHGVGGGVGAERHGNFCGQRPVDGLLAVAGA